MARVVEIANPVIDVGSESAVFESSTTRATGPSATAGSGGTARGRQFVQARTTDLSGARKLFTTYKTAQYVVIEDVSLAVIFRLIQFMVLVYAIMMLLYWHEYNVLQDVASFTNQFAKMQPFTGDAEDFV